ncbi:hypothetical protein OG455_41340 [Kitasatospora sp. NBC_01287]|uniref:hypothetical protein n=1 Tax=Kitasatospora sp. NBC_01287 TaxID=2903573 RepID=UPI002251857A|nr:hypothetical protein [Kitasatospora sp. NBC_01287]MCX4750928.1 hypothetical protein [Kitasatospora sp. NBC_01287]MCX4751821.1 hypothetical protein [Kitasatospora sp. NBC_01287]MCX4751887.1 hypothetical protein [Kitasatospora sp. NBC_01287]
MRHFSYHATVRDFHGRVLFQVGNPGIPVSNDQATDEQIRQEIKRILIEGQQWEINLTRVS